MRARGDMPRRARFAPLPGSAHFETNLMFLLRHLPWIGLVVCGALVWVLCHGGAAPFQPVSGKVTYHGLPVQTGTIVFTPDAARGTHGPLAMAEIRPDGTYLLKTGDATGASPGWYRVTVASVSTFTSGMPGQAYRIPQSLLPEKYRDPELSQLGCEIKAKTNSIDFDLE